jgi:hypothetical protein
MAVAEFEEAERSLLAAKSLMESRLMTAARNESRDITDALSHPNLGRCVYTLCIRSM